MNNQSTHQISAHSRQGISAGAQNLLFDLKYPQDLPPGWIGPGRSASQSSKQPRWSFNREICLKSDLCTPPERRELERQAKRLLNYQALKRFNFPHIMANIFVLRGLTKEAQLNSFLHPKLKRDVPDVWCLKNLKKGCDLLIAALLTRQKIALCGDYDSDGVLTSAMMFRALRNLGAEVTSFFPDRTRDGYGLNRAIVQKASQAGCRLLVTLDLGTTNNEAIAFARKLGLKVIVLDHHLIQEKNQCPADAFINPNQPGCNYAHGTPCAGSLGWLVLCGLKRRILEKKAEFKQHYQIERVLELCQQATRLSLYESAAYAALTIIADVAELSSANRAIYRLGCRALTHTKNIGLKKIMEKSGVIGALSSSDIAFAIAPRINAAGRMARLEEYGMSGAALAFSLFSTDDEETAERLAAELNACNRNRQEVEKQIFDRVEERLEGYAELPPAIVMADPEFHEGVIGIVCSRLVDKFGQTSILLAPGKDGLWKGSARGAPNEHVTEMLSQTSHRLVRYGGHRAAAGLSLRECDLEPFIKEFTALAAGRRRGQNIQPLAADQLLSLRACRQMGAELIADLMALQPCGPGNPDALFLASAVKVVDSRVHNGKHLGVILQEGESTFISGMKWHDSKCEALQPGRTVDILYKPIINKYGIFHGYAGGVEIEIIQAKGRPPV